jgi:hypothetical protein
MKGKILILTLVKVWEIVKVYEMVNVFLMANDVMRNGNDISNC